jgi:hypothetical protein
MSNVTASSRGFTPGPWEAKRSATQMCSEDTTVATVGPAEKDGARWWIFSPAEDHGDNESTARLVSAAPELLEALRVLAEIPYEAFNDVRPEHVLMGWNKHYLTIAHVQAARAAIAKATSPQRAGDGQ